MTERAHVAGAGAATTGSGPLVVYANLVSDLAVDPAERDVLRAWAEQAPREVWTLREGDVLLSPVPVAEEFLRYACDLTGVPRRSVTVLTEARTRTEDAAAVRAAAGARRPVEAVVPTALDGSAVTLARALGVPVAPYAGIEEAEAALEVTALLNTKAGFRRAAQDLGMRLPDGRVCRRDGVAAAVAALLRTHGRVVVKPDRSAGGHGLLFLPPPAGTWTAADLAAVGGERGLWVVEERIDVARSVSIQMETGPHGARPVFSGEMRTAAGSFTGYVSPLPASVPAAVRPALEAWGRALGDRLARHGYAGPFSLDAMVSADGELFAGESNVRRTATTTPHVMVTRLARLAGTGAPAWATGTVRASRPYGFTEALDRLRSHRLAYDPEHAGGVVLYAGTPKDGLRWRYAVIADGHGRLARYEEDLHAAW